MSIKKLFINDSEDDTVKETNKSSQSSQSSQSSPVTKFPQVETSQEPKPSGGFFNFGFTPPPPPPSPRTTNVSQEHIDKAMEVYQNGFSSLNQQGYDFYEYYQAILQSGVDNPQVYPMAFTIASAMDKSLTKDKLLQTADFYLNEINKVYLDFVEKGNSRKQELNLQKSNENQALLNELSLIEQQMEALKVQLEDRKNKLNAIDSKYGPMINEIDSKLLGNEQAKNTITNSIQQVKNGIINNLK